MDSLGSFKKNDATLFRDPYLRENQQNVKPHSSLLYANANDQVNQYCCNSSSQGAFFLKILFIYSTEIETASERGNTSRGRGRGRSRLIVEEHDVGLYPRDPGSRPEPKADA